MAGLSARFSDFLKLDHYPSVCFIEDVARALHTSRRTIARLRSFHSFPIPELPRLDKRPRWSGDAVRKFVEAGHTGRSLRRVGLIPWLSRYELARLR